MSQTPANGPQRYRFVVGSAEEAVTVLRKRFGASAKVVSVKQVEGAGLAKFLQAPKLEVIAEVMAEDMPGSAPVAPAPQQAYVPPTLPEEAPGYYPHHRHDAHAAPPLRAAPPQVAPPHLQAHGATPQPRVQPAPMPEALRAPVRPPVEERPPVQESRLPMLLKAGGVPNSLLARLQARSSWAEMERMPPARGLAAAAEWLREEYSRAPRQDLTERVAFIGTPGSGKTTALCKKLAYEVFCQEQRVAVLKLDLGMPNPGDGLAVYCSALGVPCARDVADVPTLEAGQSLLIDVPGLSLRETSAATELREALDMLFASSRVIVINAAYEVSLIKAAYDFAARVEATHVVFTHLDELQHWGKLWEFVLHPGLTPLFLSTGQNIAGDLELNVFDAILRRTFPSLSPAREAGTTPAELAAA